MFVKRHTISEIEIVKCISKGKLNRAISETLKISEDTLKNYLDNIYTKFSFKNSIEWVNRSI